jgi:hypothetical protein
MAQAMELDLEQGRIRWKATDPKPNPPMTGCLVRVLGSEYWRGEHTIPYEIMHTMNYIASQLFTKIGVMPGRCHFYDDNGKRLDNNQAVPPRAVCIYGDGVDLPEQFTLGIDDFKSAQDMEELKFQKYPPFEPANSIGEITSNFSCFSLCLIYDVILTTILM